mmetsp:Transcript_10955/g.16132  ORF Transcript_10955/g.16132 Transcript_10955/m.16132 type:complete len:178 (+) Transcript_10955:74-607(+)
MSDKNFDGLTSLIAFTGFSMPARARFVAQFIGSTLFSSITCGLVAGQTGAMMLSCGPLIPFMTGSWFGYTVSCVGFWKQSKKKALTYARRYPKVLAHSLETDLNMQIPKNVTMDDDQKTEGSSSSSSELRGKSLEEWIHEGGTKRLSFAILAAQSCEEDIAEMQKNERQKLIHGYSN